MRVLGVLSGNDMPASQIEAWARSADAVYAADGGANVLQSLGITPRAIVGDFDSISDAAREGAPLLVHAPDQNASDCDKLLALLASEGNTLVTLCNVEGDRLDHVLATLHSAAKSPINVRLALRTSLAIIVKAGSKYRWEVPPESRLSLLPLEPCSGVELHGVRWELHHADLAPRGETSLSNIASGPIEVALGSGCAVLFLPFQNPVW